MHMQEVLNHIDCKDQDNQHKSLNITHIIACTIYIQKILTIYASY